MATRCGHENGSLRERNFAFHDDRAKAARPEEAMGQLMTTQLRWRYSVTCIIEGPAQHTVSINRKQYHDDVRGKYAPLPDRQAIASGDIEL
jgi:hypothetical protein